MTTDVIPVLRVADASTAVAWYRRLGFEVSFEHRFEAGLPLYVGIRRDGAQLHLSEHTGDARPDTLVFVWVDDVDAVAAEFGVDIEEMPWARQVELTDPDGNRLRVGAATFGGTADADGDQRLDMMLGDGTAAALTDLETAMWVADTRGDRAWMDAHLSDDFHEFGRSGRHHDRAAVLGAPVGTEIDVELPLRDVTITALGRDAALVTYRSVHTDGEARRASVWRRAGTWRLAFHQGTPAT